MHHKRILIIDDDRRLHEGISDFLTPFGFTIVSLLSGDEAIVKLADIAPDLILLDIMLPGEKDGLTLLCDIRLVSVAPVIMLTARGEETDRIVGLEMGADDYLSKPFSLRELLARIKAVLRRTPIRKDGAENTPPGENKSTTNQPSATFSKKNLRTDNFILDTQRHSLHWNDHILDLSTSEVRILEVFLTHKGEVLSRDRIQSLAFGDAYCAGDRTIDVHISRVRSLIRTLDTSLSPIRTVWGAGYRWMDNTTP